MTRALEQAEAQARKAVDDWIAAGHALACYPGASAWMMPWASVDPRAKMLEGAAERFAEEAIKAFRARSTLQ